MSGSDEGYFVATSVQNQPLTFLVDSGSSVTIINKSMVQSWPPNTCPPLHQTTVKLITATGGVAPFHGKMTVDMQIGTQKFTIPVLVADIQNDGILGRDFLRGRCNLLGERNILTVNGEEIHCFENSNQCPNVCRIAVSETVEIPPESELIIYGRQLDPYLPGNSGLIEAREKFVQQSGILVAKALVTSEDGRVPMRLANLHPEKRIIHRNTIVAQLEPVSHATSQSFAKIATAQTTDSPCIAGVPQHLVDVYTRCTANLTGPQAHVYKNLLIKFQDVFAKDPDDLGLTPLMEFDINTGDNKPVQTPPYRLPLSKRKAAEAEIQRLAKGGIIEPACSPWLSPVVLVTKPDNTVRFCIDFRKVNKNLVNGDAHPIPRCDDQINQLSGNSWFSTMDCKSAYHQVGIQKKDRPKTAFAIPGSSQWQFKRMPFGLTTCPAAYERLMERVFSGVSYEICLIYLDDILSPSKTFEDQVSNLETIFSRLRESGLKLCPKKCNFFQKVVTFLGHRISEAGVEPCPEKVKTVVDWPRPQNVRAVRSFIGLASYYRKMIQGFATVAKPLHKLTEKNARFKWDNECEVAFNTLKKLLTESPILAFPDTNENAEYILDSDASDVGVGCVLSQIQNGHERVIGYYSRCLSRTERRYCVTRKELLSMICGVKHFHHFLYGTQFRCRTDHGSLRYLLNFKNCEGQLARWLEILSAYQFKIEYRPGRVHSNCDALSRRPCYDQKCKYCDRAEQKYELKTDKSLDSDSCPVNDTLLHAPTDANGPLNPIVDRPVSMAKIEDCSMLVHEPVGIKIPSDHNKGATANGPVHQTETSCNNTTVSQEDSSNEGYDLGQIHDTSPETNSLCMENIALVQSSDPVLSYFKVWKSDGRNPSGLK
ncbi:MAG: reverse transcriptase domain-containing protein [Sedimenticola sp.]